MVNAKAQQLLGGEIFYQHVDSSKYTVDVKLYRACNDSAFLPTLNVLAKVNGFGTDSILLNRIGIKDNSSYCKDSSSPCSPVNTLSGKGMEVHHYQANINVNKGPYSAWINNGACKFYFEYKGNNRKGDYLYTSDSTPLHLFALLDICKLKQCQDTTNSSVGFYDPPNLYLNENTTYHLNMGGNNLDSDSMVYNPYCPNGPGVYGAPCTSTLEGKLFLTDYCISSSPCTPIPQAKPAIGTFHDEYNGDLVFTPTKKGEQGELFVRAFDYRLDTNNQYVLVGYAMRSSTFIVDSFAKNNPPALLGPYNYSVCEGEELCFDIKTKDDSIAGSAPDSTYLSWSENLVGATFAYVDSNAREKTARLCWTPAVGAGRSVPYHFNVKAWDLACPRPESLRRGYSITVKKKGRMDSVKIAIQNCDKVIFEGFGSAVWGVPKYRWRVFNSYDSLIFNGANKRDSINVGADGGAYVFEFRINNSASCPVVRRDTIEVKPKMDSINVDIQNCGKVIVEGYGSTTLGPGVHKWRVLDINDSLISEYSQKRDTINIGSDGGIHIIEYTLTNINGCANSLRDTIPIVPYLKMVNVQPLIRCFANYGPNPFPNPIKNFPETINSIGSVEFSYSVLAYFGDIKDTTTPFRDYSHRGRSVLLVAKDSLGCQNSDTVDFNTHYYYYNNLKSNRICDGDTAELSVPKFPYLNYLWSNGDTTAVLDGGVTNSGVYTVTISDSSQCVDTFYEKWINIEVNEPFNANAGNDTLICENSDNKFVAGDSVLNQLNYIYTWYSYPKYTRLSSNKYLNVLIDTAQRFALQLRQTEGGLVCTDWDTLSVGVIKADKANLLDSQAYCYSDSAVYLDSLSKPFISKTQFSLISFNNATNGSSFLDAKSLLEDSALLKVKDAPGRYLIQGSNTNTSCLATDTTLVIVNAEPKVLIKHADTVCQSAQIGLNVYSNPALTFGAAGSNWAGEGVVNNRIEAAKLFDSAILKMYQGPHSVYGDYVDPITGCGSFDSIQFYIQRNPQIQLTYKDSVAVCNGKLLTIGVKKKYTSSLVKASTLGDGIMSGVDTLFSFYHGDNDANNGFSELYFYTAQDFMERCVADTQYLKVSINNNPKAQFQVSDISKDSVSINNLSSSFVSGFYVLNYMDTIPTQIGLQRIGKLIKESNHAQLWIVDSNGCEDSISVFFNNNTAISLLQLYGVRIPTLWDKQMEHISLSGYTNLRHMKMEAFAVSGQRIFESEHLPLVWSKRPAAGIYVIQLRAEMNDGKVFSVSSKLRVE